MYLLGTRHACRAYIEEAMRDKIKEGTPNPFGDDLFDVSHLAGHVWESIAGVIQSARKVMDYIKDVADIYADRRDTWNG